MQQTEKKNLTNWSELLFAILLTSILPYLLCTYFKINFLVSCFLGLIFFIIYAKDTLIKLHWKNASIFFIAFLLLGFATQYVYDLSFDGLYYHQNAIIQFLTKGQSASFKWLHSVDMETNPNGLIWNTHYTTGVEGSQAFFAQLFFNVESGKMYAIILSAFTLLHIYQSLCKLQWFANISKTKIFFIAISFVLSPVILIQAPTLLVDHGLHLVICNLFFVLLNWAYHKKLNGRDAIILAYFLFMSVHAKASGLIFVSLIIASFIIVCLHNKTLNSLIIPIKNRLLTIVFCVSILSIQPYITNLINHKTIIFPTSNINEANKLFGLGVAPLHFETINYWQRILYGYLGHSGSANLIDQSGLQGNGDLKLKIPFTFNKKEWLAFYRYDIKKGGFGPFFSGFLCLAFITFILVLCKKNVPKKDKKHIGLFLIMFIIIPILLVPASYFARYQATLWWLVPLTLFMLIYYFKNKWIPSVFIALLCIQSLGIAGINYGRTLADSYVFKECLDAVNNGQANFYSTTNQSVASGIEHKISAHLSARVFSLDTTRYVFVPANPAYFLLAINKQNSFKMSPISQYILRFRNKMKQ